MPWFFKLGLLTCVVSVAFRIVLEAAVVALMHLGGVGFRIDGAGLKLGARCGAIFGARWLIWFSAARWIVYVGIKSSQSILAN